MENRKVNLDQEADDSEAQTKKEGRKTTDKKCKAMQIEIKKKKRKETAQKISEEKRTNVLNEISE